jgi:predicted transcriptional regulator
MATETPREWTFLTNHTHVLLCLHGTADMRLRDVAQLVGITERAVQSIVADLIDSKYLRRERQGRRNTYEVSVDLPLRHQLERQHSIGELLEILHPSSTSPAVAR